MGTTENQGYFRLLTRLVNRIFFRRQDKTVGQSSYERTLRSLHNGDLKSSHSSYHGDEEAFWFI
ncbi:MAG: hypothetical protein K0S53_425 [Bacteroidetes bacterium]|jgi:hypothetical protein|nr:hypothetical protein [Bacteroidota bacterium]MDF2451858.1 hypothetical protein [Bacteroidota bacterium]